MTWNAIWKDGTPRPPEGPVHVSMNDYLIHRLRDIPGVAWEGVRLRHRLPETEGALGLWVAAFAGGRRQVSVSVWRAAEDLKRFVHSPIHLRIMREYRDAGALYTNAWTAARLDRALIWRQASTGSRGASREFPTTSPTGPAGRRGVPARRSRPAPGPAGCGRSACRAAVDAE